MKIREIKIHEMAMRGGNLTVIADKWAQKIKDSMSTNDEVLDKIDDLIVKVKSRTYTLWQDDELVFIAEIDKLPDSTCTIDNIWVNQKFRGQKILSKFLIWLKVKQHQKEIIFGDIHSDDTYNILKSGALKAFKKSWRKPWSNEKIPFDVDTVDQFYGAGKWKLILENDVDVEWLLQNGGFTHTYEALVNVFDNHENL